MNVRYLLDTDTLSEPTKPLPREGLMRRLKSHGGQFAIPSVVWHQVLFGFLRVPPGAKRENLRVYYDEISATVPVLDYDKRAADWHARERARLVAIGRTPPFEDGQIAAIAAVNELVLVTNNVKDFKFFKGLEVVSWAS